VGGSGSVLRRPSESPRGVQCLADELDDDLADELLDGAA
jgi:hypothetical protein